MSARKSKSETKGLKCPQSVSTVAGGDSSLLACICPSGLVYTVSQPSITSLQRPTYDEPWRQLAAPRRWKSCEVQRRKSISSSSSNTSSDNYQTYLETTITRTSGTVSLVRSEDNVTHDESCFNANPEKGGSLCNECTNVMRNKCFNEDIYESFGGELDERVFKYSSTCSQRSTSNPLLPFRRKSILKKSQESMLGAGSGEGERRSQRKTSRSTEKSVMCDMKRITDEELKMVNKQPGVDSILRTMDALALDRPMIAFSMREDGIALQKGVPLKPDYSKDTIIKFHKRHYVICKGQEPVKTFWRTLKKICFFHFLIG